MRFIPVIMLLILIISKSLAVATGMQIIESKASMVGSTGKIIDSDIAVANLLKIGDIEYRNFGLDFLERFSSVIIDFDSGTIIFD